MSRAGGVATGGRVICNTRGRDECDETARFRVTADGYPQPMYAGVCAEHLGLVLLGDVSTPGSTARWIVEAL